MISNNNQKILKKKKFDVNIKKSTNINPEISPIKSKSHGNLKAKKSCNLGEYEKDKNNKFNLSSSSFLNINESIDNNNIIMNNTKLPKIKPNKNNNKPKY